MMDVFTVYLYRNEGQMDRAGYWQGVGHTVADALASVRLGFEACEARGDTPAAPEPQQGEDEEERP